MSATYCYIHLLWIIISVSEVTGTNQSRTVGEDHKRSNNSGDGDSEPTFDRNQALKRLSKVFGISRIPKDFHHRTPPEYMLELFSNVAYSDGVTKQSAPYNADVVRGIPDKALHQQIKYFFNVSHIEDSEDVLQAEFHIFKLPARPSGGYSTHVIELRLYQILDPDQREILDVQRLLHHRRVSLHDRGWEIFTVKDTVKEWVTDKTTNHGFLIVSSSRWTEENSGQHIRFAQKSEHHDSKQPLLVVFTEDMKKQQLLQDPVAEAKTEYSDIQPVDVEDILEESELDKVKNKVSNSTVTNSTDLSQSAVANNSNNVTDISELRKNYIRFLNERHRAEHGSLPIRRNYMSPELHRLLQQSENRSQSGTRRKRGADYYNKYPKRRKKTCARHELYVDFEKIGWSSWIISPKGYNARHCKGACPFPLGQNQQPTNHATVQSIVHSLRVGKDVGTPCCVPNELYSISLLYFDDHENVILKQYDDMTAVSCGCH